MIDSVAIPGGIVTLADPDHDRDALTILSTTVIVQAASSHKEMKWEEVRDHPHASQIHMFISIMMRDADEFWFRYHDVMFHCEKSRSILTASCLDDDPLDENLYEPDMTPFAGNHVGLQEGRICVVYGEPIKHAGAVAAFGYLCQLHLASCMDCKRLNQMDMLAACSMGVSLFSEGGFRLNRSAGGWKWNADQDQLLMVFKADFIESTPSEDDLRKRFDDFIDGEPECHRIKL